MRVHKFEMLGGRSQYRYTVKHLARLSGVSIRTLHHYDAIGLLKPAAIGENGYRYYGRAELIRLQQILLNRELGLSLAQIRGILDAPDFDRAQALLTQRALLLGEQERLHQLVRNVDEALAELQGGETVDAVAMYRGFSAEVRAKSEAWALERYGRKARWVEARANGTRTWDEADWDRHAANCAALFQEFATALGEGLAADSEAVLEISQRFRLTAAHTLAEPLDAAELVSIADTITENPYIRAGLDRFAPDLADYVAIAMRALATRDSQSPTYDPRPTAPINAQVESLERK